MNSYFLPVGQIVRSWLKTRKHQQRAVRGKYRSHRLESEALEERRLMSTVTDAGSSTLSIALDNSETLAVVSNGSTYTLTSNVVFNNGGVSNSSDFSVFGVKSLTIQASAISRYTTAISIDDAAGASTVAKVTFNNSGSNSYANNFNVNLNNPAAGAITFNGSSIFSGSSALSASTALNIVANSGAVVSTAGGNLTLSANQQATPTIGSFSGILVNGATVQSNTGNILLQGTGGTSGHTQFGVVIQAGGKVQTTGGSVAVRGTGGNSDSNSDIGVYVTGADALGNGSTITAGGTGTVTVTGTGGAGPSYAHYGVGVDAGGIITSSGGNVLVTGTGGGSLTSVNDHGVYLSGGTISAGGSATVTVNGTGGGVSSAADVGVYLATNGSVITSGPGGGNVSVTGAGGVQVTGVGSVIQSGAGGGNVSVIGTATSTGTDGVIVSSSGTITAGAGGTVTVQGTGSSAPLNNANGVTVNGGTITSSGGTVAVTGTGGNAAGVGSNLGVQVLGAGVISAGGNAAVTVTGTGGATTGNSNYGVQVSGSGSQITSGGGNVSVTGTGGGSGASGNDYGVEVGTAGTITAGGTGTVIVNGTGGATTANNQYGVYVTVAGAQITSGGGNVSVTGTGGGSGSANNYGVEINVGTISSGGAGTVTVNGTGGLSSGSTNGLGVVLQSSGSVIQSGPGGGSVAVTGAGGVFVNGAGSVIQSGSGGGNVSVIGIATSAGSDGVTVDFGGAINAGASGTVTVQGTGSSVAANNANGITVNGGTITSSGGAVAVTGTGGSATGTGSNYGVEVLTGSSNSVTYPGAITAGGNATVTVSGTGGAASGNNTYNYGVYVTGTGAQITSGGGNVSVTGFGGGADTSATNTGVDINVGTISAGGSGTVTVNGTGGTSGGGTNFGVNLERAGSVITSGPGGGSVSVTGAGGVFVTGSGSAIQSGGNGNVSVVGTATTTGSYGVLVQSSATITAGGNGTVTVQGTGSDSSVNNEFGVFVNSGSITSSGGAVTVTGTGGTGTKSNFGVELISGSISAGGSGSVNVTGTGGATAANSDFGVYVNGTGALITSSGGNVSVTGFGGGTGTSSSHHGVVANAGGKISAGGIGTVTVKGTGGSVTGSAHGVSVSGGTITSSGGVVSVTGTGGGSATSANNHGVDLSINGALPGVITAGGTGTVTVTGTGGATSGNNDWGVGVSGAGSMITSGGGNVSVTGTGGGSGGSTSNYGVDVASSGTITAGSGGTVTIQGNGGGGTAGNVWGVYVNGGTITSAGGAVSVTGAGGSAGGGGNHGINVAANSTISAGSTGTVTVTGTGGATTGNTNDGVVVSGTNAFITSGGGNVSIIGNAGGKSTSANDHGVVVSTNGTVTAGGSGTLTINGTGGVTSGATNRGVAVSGTGAIKSGPGGGDVTIVGTCSGTATDGIGIAISQSGTIQATGTANLSLTGTASAATTAAIDATGGSLTVGSGLVSLTGDVIDLGANSVSSSGSGQLLFQPKTTSRPIVLGGSDTSGKLVFTDTDRAALADGFSLITIGSATGTGAVTTASNLTPFTDNVTIQTPGAGSGGITLTNTLSATANVATLVSGSTINQGSGGLLAAGTANLTAPSGIGASGNPLALQVAALSTDSSGGNGGQFLSETGTAVVAGVNGLNAGSGSIKLVAGAFQVDGSATAGGGVTVQNGATLSGVGTVNGSATALSGGTVSPGDTPGILTTGNFSLNSGSNFNVSLNGTTVGSQYSQENVTGSANLNADNGAATLNLGLGYAPSAGDQFIILKSGSAIAGTFAGLAEGATLTASNNGTTYRFTISFIGNQVVLTAGTSTATSISAPSITYGSNATVVVTVGATAGTATGNVSLRVGANAPIVQPLVNGSSTFTLSGLGASTYTLSASYAAQGGFYASSGSGSITVNRATPVLNLNPINMIYGPALAGTQISGTATATVNGSPVTVAGTYSFNGGNNIHLNVGNGQSQAVTFTPTDAVDYTTASGVATINVTPATLTATATAANREYNRTPDANVTITLTGIVGSDVVTATALTARFSSQFAGTWTVTLNGITLGGAAAGNYLLSNTTTTTQATIFQKTLTPTVTTAAGKTYDGTTSEAAPTIALLGVLNGDTVTATGVASFADASAGLQTVNVTGIVLGGSAPLAYRLASTTITTTATIARANATVIVNPYTVTYDGAAHTATVGSITGVHGETGATVGAVDLSGTTHTTAGSYTTDSWSFAGASNYNSISSQTVADTVNKATPTATLALSNSPLTYSGSGQSATVGISASSVPGTIANILTGGAASQTNAGTYAVTADFVPTDTTNYNSISNVPAGNLVINKATPAITWATPGDITYGTALSGSQLNASSTVAGTFSYSIASGTVLDVGTRALGVTFTPADVANYTTVTASVNLLVRKASSTTTVTVANGVYDGTSHAATASVVGANLSQNLPVTYTGINGTVYAASTTAPTNAGDYSASGTFAGDANHTGGADSKSFTIAKANGSAVVTGYSVSYDGAAHTAAGSATGVDGDALPAGDFSLDATTHTDATGGTVSDAWTFHDPSGNYADASGTVDDRIDQIGATIAVDTSAASTTYDGSGHAASGSATGVLGEDLSGLLHLSYSTDGGQTFSADAPVNAGTYEVYYTFQGSTDYTAIASPTDSGQAVTISPATPVITLSDAGGTYNGQPFAATASIAGIVAGVDDAPDQSLEGTPLTLDYVNTDTHTDLGSTAPTDAGHYSVTASFAGSADYSSGSQTVDFTVAQVRARVSVRADSGDYNGRPYDATATVADSDGNPLDSTGVTYWYYTISSGKGFGGSGGSIAGQPTNVPRNFVFFGNTAPVHAGDYGVIAVYPGDANHATAQSDPTRFNIGQLRAVIAFSYGGGVYNGTAYAGTATVAGAVEGFDDTPGASLEGEPLTIGYFNTDTDVDLGSTAPTAAGHYYFTFGFAGSQDYEGSAAPQLNFTISQATPVITVSDAGGVYSGNPFTATTSIAGVVIGIDDAPALSLEGTPVTLDYVNTDTNTDLGSTAPTAAGHYAVTASFAGSADYVGGSASTTFQITQAAPTVAINAAGGVYTGNPYAASATVAGTGGAALDASAVTFTYYSVSSGGSVLTPISGAPIHVGHYAVIASNPASANYVAAASGAVFFDITPAAAQVNVVGYATTYDGQSHAATGSAIGVSGVNLSGGLALGASAHTNAGTFADAWTFHDPSGDYQDASGTVSDSISQAGSTVSVSWGGTSTTYDGNQHSATAAWASTGADGEGAPLTVSYYLASDLVHALPGAPSDAGSYVAVASFAGDANHTGGSDSKAFTIEKATSTTTTVGADPFTYNGALQAGGSGTVTGAGGLNTNATSLTYAGDQTNAGIYYVTAHYAGDANHLASDGSAVAITINKAASTTTATGAAFTYDGTTHTGGSATVAGAGTITGTPVLTYLGDQVNAGSYTVIATYAGDANHTASSSSATITIAKAASTTTATGAAFTYDGTTHTGGSAIVAGVGTITGTPVLTYIGDQVNAGSYTVIDTYAGDANHNGSSNSATITIAKAASTTTATGAAFTYDGTTHTGGSATVAGAGTITGTPVLTYLGDQVNAGSYTVIATYAGDANHTASSSSATITIAKAASTTTTIGAGPFIYNGNAQVGGSGTVSGAGGLSTSATSLTYSANADGTGTADQTNVGTYYVTAHYAGDANHTASDGAAVAITIAKAASINPIVTANVTSVTTPEGTTAVVTGTFSDGNSTAPALTASKGTITQNNATGTWSWTYTPADNESTQTITITATGSSGAKSTVTFTFAATNVGPTANADAATTTQAAAITVNARANDTDPAGVNDPLTIVGVTQGAYGSVVVTAAGNLVYTPTSTFSGTDTFSYTISDGDGGTSTATVTVNVTPKAGEWSLVPDAAGAGSGVALAIEGTSGDDDIRIYREGRSCNGDFNDEGDDDDRYSGNDRYDGNGNRYGADEDYRHRYGNGHERYVVWMNGKVIATLDPTTFSRIIIYGRDGNDRVHCAGSLEKPTWIFGGNGNDDLRGGGTESVIVGGEGNDRIRGGNGRDLLIGGEGADTLYGNAEEDILIAGYTDHDNNLQAIRSVMTEWSRTNVDFLTRVAHLRDGGGLNGSVLINSITVKDDRDTDHFNVDLLNGGGGNDWLVYELNEDKVQGMTATEAKVDITDLLG